MHVLPTGWLSGTWLGKLPTTILFEYILMQYIQPLRTSGPSLTYHLFWWWNMVKILELEHELQGADATRAVEIKNEHGRLHEEGQRFLKGAHAAKMHTVFQDLKAAVKIYEHFKGATVRRRLPPGGGISFRYLLRNKRMEAAALGRESSAEHVMHVPLLLVDEMVDDTPPLSPPKRVNRARMRRVDKYVWRAP